MCVDVCLRSAEFHVAQSVCSQRQQTTVCVSEHNLCGTPSSVTTAAAAAASIMATPAWLVCKLIQNHYKTKH